MKVLQLAYAQPRTLVFSCYEYFYLQCGILPPHNFVKIILFHAFAVSYAAFAFWFCKNLFLQLILSSLYRIKCTLIRIIIIIIYRCSTPHPNYRLRDCRFFFRPASSQLRPVLAGCRLIWLTTTLSPQSSACLTPP
jgi:hypothetical protein